MIPPPASASATPPTGWIVTSSARPDVRVASPAPPADVVGLTGPGRHTGLRKVCAWQLSARSKRSPDTAGRSPSSQVTRWPSTCRRRADARCRSRWPASAHGRTVVFEEHDVPVDDLPTPGDAFQHGCGWPAATELTVDSGLAIGLLRGRAVDRRRWQDPSQPRVLRRPATTRLRPTSRSCSRSAPTRGTPTTTSVDATCTPGRRRCRCNDRWRPGTCTSPTAPASGSPRCIRPTRGRRPTSRTCCSTTCRPYGGSAGWPNWELPFVRWAEREGYDVRRRHQRRPRGPPRTARPVVAVPAVPVDRPRRVLVGRHARHRGVVHRSRRERRVPVRQHVVLAGSPRGSGRTRRTRRHDDRVQGCVQARPGLRHRSPVGADDPLVGSPARTAREPHDRRQLHPRRLPPHRQAGHVRRRGLHAAPARSTGSSTAPASTTATCSAPARPSSATSATAATSRIATGSPTRPAPTARPPTSRSSARRRPPTSPARPPRARRHRNEPAEDEFIAARVFNTRDPEAIEKIAHGHAILGTYVSAGGGTVITSGSTDWVWGLAERDPLVEQITRNILDRLGSDAPADV